MATDRTDVETYPARKGVPEKFVWPRVPDGGLAEETIELVGTLRAGNPDEIFVLADGIVLRLPMEAILGLGDSVIGPAVQTTIFSYPSSAAGSGEPHESDLPIRLGDD